MNLIGNEAELIHNNAEDEFRVISPEAIRAARGLRSRMNICEKTGNKINPQMLYNYESGYNGIAHENLPLLLSALGVTYEDITVAVERDENGNIPEKYITYKMKAKQQKQAMRESTSKTNTATGLTSASPSTASADLSWLYDE